MAKPPRFMHEEDGMDKKILNSDYQNVVNVRILTPFGCSWLPTLKKK